jgi:hypothetical protein
MKDDDSSPDSKEDFAIDQEDDNSVKNQKRKAELKILEKCFRIIEHEIINKKYISGKLYNGVKMLDKLNSLKRDLI